MLAWYFGGGVGYYGRWATWWWKCWGPNCDDEA